MWPVAWGGTRIIALIVQDSQLLNGLVILSGHSEGGQQSFLKEFFHAHFLIGPIYRYPISMAPT